MNLNKLFSMQQELDKRIEQEHPREEGRDRLAEKILALQVELGECANEWRGFKFWSKDQVARRKRLLEEFVDCLHFILSIGEEPFIYYGEKAPVNLELPKIISPIKYETVTKQFNYLFNTVSYMMDCVCECEWGTDTETGEQYTNLFRVFIGLGEMLGFTWDQVEKAYIEKNAVNFQRQAEGY